MERPGFRRQGHKAAGLGMLLVTAIGALLATAMLVANQLLERDYHRLWMQLSHARSQAIFTGKPITVRFVGRTVQVDDYQGQTLARLTLNTRAEVRYRTRQGNDRVLFGPSGQTSPYNIHLHGGDITLHTWTGKSRSLWIHCTGGITTGRNTDWTLN